MVLSYTERRNWFLYLIDEQDNSNMPEGSSGPPGEVDGVFPEQVPVSKMAVSRSSGLVPPLG